MSIWGEYNYNRYAQTPSMPEWARVERYDFCDGFYEDYTSKKGHFFAHLASMLLSIF